MSTKDFIALNVPRMLARYSNPPTNWHSIVITLARTQIDVMNAHAMINPNAAVLSTPVDNAVIMFSDYTSLGQEFVMSGAVDRWLAACDRAGDVSAYEKRILKYLATRRASAS